MRKYVTFILIVSCIISSKLLYAQSNDLKIKVSRVTGNIYKLFINDHVNTFAMTGKDGILLVDTGYDYYNEQVKSELKRFGNYNIKYIINTHADWDHITGNSGLRQNATVISHEACKKQISDYSVADTRFEKEIFIKALPDFTFNEKVTLHFNDEEIDLIYMPGAHTDEDIIVYFKNAKVACMGDMFIPGTFPVVKLDNGGKVNKVVETIDKVMKIFPVGVKFVFGHGVDYTLNDLKKYRDMVTKTTGIVTGAVKAGKTLEQMKKENILKEWSSWSGTVKERLNSDMWIETIFNSLSK